MFLFLTFDCESERSFFIKEWDAVPDEPLNLMVMSKRAGDYAKHLCFDAKYV